MGNFNNYQFLSGHGVVVIKEKMVSFKDIERVNKNCTSVKIYENQTIASFFPLEYLIDDRRGIKNPLGEIGERLEVRGLIIICGKGGTFNLKELVKAFWKYALHRIYTMFVIFRLQQRKQLKL